ncbi:MAG: phosphate butyryltransferase [Hyphomicrobiaceae bacterium]|jgi:phosphate butyryltransferase
MVTTPTIRDFDQLLERVKDHPIKRVAIACGDMATVVAAAARAEQERVADAILFGDRDRTMALADQAGLDLTTAEFVDIADRDEAAAAAVAAVSRGEADIVMKGYIHSDDFLRAVLQRTDGLRSGRMLSHTFLLEVPHLERILFVTDGAMNIAPDFEKKAQIARNSIALARLYGIDQPKVAVLAAVELVNPRMQATQDAAILSLMSHRGQFEHGVVEGPFALDNAISVEAAAVKGIENSVAGRADVLLVPDIEAGNILVKSYVYLARGRIAGLVLGATAPVVLTSRADTAESKFLSIAAAVYAAQLESVRVKLGRSV